MNRLEAFINWQNDLHWGPLEKLRPAKSADIDGRRLALLCAFGSMTTMGCLILVLWLGGVALYFGQYQQIPPLAAVVRKPLQLMAQLWWLILGAGVAFPLLFLPYLLCWNRRADYLRKNPAPLQPVQQDGVWPPPPQQG